MTAEKSLAVVVLVTLLRNLSVAVSITNIASKRGRPPTIATLLSRVQASSLAKTRQADAPQPSSERSSAMTALLNEGAFASVRKSYGLHHKTIPDSLVLDVLALDEGPDPEYEARYAGALSYAALRERTMAALTSREIAIHCAAVAGGSKSPGEPRIKLVEKKAPGVIEKLAAGGRYKAAARELENSSLDTSDIPAERTLRRWIREKSDVNSKKK